MLVWGHMYKNKFERIEKQHVRAAELKKNILGIAESNRVLEKVGGAPIIHIYKRKVAIEMYKIVEEKPALQNKKQKDYKVSDYLILKV